MEPIKAACIDQTAFLYEREYINQCIPRTAGTSGQRQELITGGAGEEPPCLFQKKETNYYEKTQS